MSVVILELETLVSSSAKPLLFAFHIDLDIFRHCNLACLYARADIFQADGKVQILDKSVFDRFAKANNASAALSDPRLLQVTIFID